jgi:hypothetical protein
LFEVDHLDQATYGMFLTELRPPYIDDHIVAELGVQVVVETKIDDAIIMGMKRSVRILAEDGST